MRRLPVLVVAAIVLAGSLTAAPDRRSRGSRGRRRPPAASATGSDPPTDRPVGERQRHRRHADLDADDQHGRHRLHRAPQHDVRLRLHDDRHGHPALGDDDDRQPRHRDVLLRAAVGVPELGQRRLERGDARPWAASRRATRTAPRNAADTGGDNNGYETNPGNALCPRQHPRARHQLGHDDLARSVPTRARTATATGATRSGCRAASAPSSGIQVQPTIEVNNNGGSSLICVQLSWDGGASWTATKQVNVTNSLTTYTLGSATDTWGHTWTLAQLNTTNFRVRIIDVSSHEREGLRPRRHPGPGQLHPVDSGG